MIGATYFDMAAYLNNHSVKYVNADLVNTNQVEVQTEYQIPEYKTGFLVQIFYASNQEVALAFQKKPDGGAYSTLKTFYVNQADRDTKLVLPLRFDPLDTLRLKTTFSAGTNIKVNAGYSLILIDDTK